MRRMIRRRDLLKAGIGLAAAGVGYALTVPFRRRRGEPQSLPSDVYSGATASAEPHDLHEARYYVQGKNKTVRCELCFHKCHIREGETGFCRNRINRGGTLYNEVYNRPSAVNIDPTEKEPIHHFLPGTHMLCIGTASCNYRCRFCHNWHLSHRSFSEIRRHQLITPDEMVGLAKRHRVPSISYTYNEPTVFFEYMQDISIKAHAEGVRTIIHSNGGMSPEPLRDILRHTDAMTVDLKGFNHAYYRTICGGELNPVLDSLRIIRESGVWLELVNLVLPGYNDDADEVRAMIRWIREHLGESTPLHFSRFSPTFQMTHLPPTPVVTLERCRQIALREGLHHVSIGNVPGHEANSSFCPACGQCIIRRHHFAVTEIHMEDGACAACGEVIPGVWT